MVVTVLTVSGMDSLGEKQVKSVPQIVWTPLIRNRPIHPLYDGRILIILV